MYFLYSIVIRMIGHDLKFYEQFRQMYCCSRTFDRKKPFPLSLSHNLYGKNYSTYNQICSDCGNGPRTQRSGNATILAQKFHSQNLIIQNGSFTDHHLLLTLAIHFNLFSMSFQIFSALKNIQSYMNIYLRSYFNLYLHSLINFTFFLYIYYHHFDPKGILPF